MNEQTMAEAAAASIESTGMRVFTACAAAAAAFSPVLRGTFDTISGLRSGKVLQALAGCVSRPRRMERRFSATSDRAAFDPQAA